MPDSRSGKNEKGPIEDGPFSIDGRRGGIRTRDPLHPMQVRYQAALHAEALNYSVNSPHTVSNSRISCSSLCKSEPPDDAQSADNTEAATSLAGSSISEADNTPDALDARSV